MFKDIFLLIEQSISIILCFYPTGDSNLKWDETVTRALSTAVEAVSLWPPGEICIVAAETPLGSTQI